MGCASVNITRFGGDLAALFERQGERPSINFKRSGGDLAALFERQGEAPSINFKRSGGMHVRFGLVCGTNIGDGFLFASDGLLITIDDGKLIVKQS